jgi:hypothetical protein
MKHIPLLKEEFNFSTPHYLNLFAKERKRELCAERADTEFDGYVPYSRIYFHPIYIF